MSTEKRTIKVGILPEQTEDYSRYEESELNWGRIVSAATLLLIIVSIFIFLFKSSDNATINTPDPSQNESYTEDIARLKSPSVQPNIAASKTSSTPKVVSEEPSIQTAKANGVASIAVISTAAVDPKQNAPLSQPSEVASAAAQKTEAQDLHRATHPVKLIKPVKVLNSNITVAQLSSNLIKGRPVDSLPAEILMSEEGIIRVHLYTEMTNLRGQNLYHHWYRNGVKQARVRVPINHNNQRSSSSKFINKQMLGKWSVQVLDEQGKAYIEANFEVIKP